MRKNKGGSEIWATEAEILAVSSVFDCNIKVLIENKSDIITFLIKKPLWSFSESVISTSEHEFFLKPAL
jgi:hypothetical protein